MQYVAAYFITAVVFAAIDFVWLTLASERLYKPELGPLLAETPRLIPAVIFYGLYILGVTVFCVAPALKSGSLRHALILGGLFGLVAYATYDLTNQATLTLWSTRVTLFDLAWGTALTAVAATAGTAATRLLFSRLTP